MLVQAPDDDVLAVGENLLRVSIDQLKSHVGSVTRLFLDQVFLLLKGIHTLGRFFCKHHSEEYFDRWNIINTAARDWA